MTDDTATATATEDECQICMDAAVAMRLHCGHLLCGGCFDGLRERPSPVCPFWRRALGGVKMAPRRQAHGGDLTAVAARHRDLAALFALFRHGCCCVEVAAALSDKRELLRQADSHGNTALHVAAQNGRLRVARLIVAQGAELDRTNATGQTALHYAVTYKYGRVASYLCRVGASDAVRNAYGLTC